MCDIFISFKHTDENGNVTEDSVIAEDLYKMLTAKGYKEFFYNKSLEGTGNPKFKKEIDDALDKAKIMIVVLTKAEYATSRWVNYEWDTYYGDFLSGVRNEIFMYTYTKNFSVNELPRTLRNLQNFSAEDGAEELLKYIRSVLPVETQTRYKLKDNSAITFEDIKNAVNLDHCVFEGMEHVSPEECWRWFKLNPDIYCFIEDTQTQKIVAYTNTAPITEECYDKIKSGKFLTTNITENMILSFEMPYPYSLYFFSVVIHPQHQNTQLFFMLVSALVEKFIGLTARDVYIKRMIADAVTPNGEKFCKLFGMNKITESAHSSSLYEVQMIPPQFKKISKKVKELYDCYQAVYDEMPDLFTE